MAIDQNTWGFSKSVAEALQASIVNGETETPEASHGSRHAIVILTPSGGIPARVGTTVGKANCTIYAINSSDVLASTGVSVSVVNLAATAVAGSVYGQAKRAGGRWVIDYEECE
jgi:hypothetical protein